MVTESVVSDGWRFPKLGRVVRNINGARKLDKFTDVTFFVGRDGDFSTIRAHRVVFGTANAELAKLVSSSEKHLKVWIRDVSAKGFKNLIRFLYDIPVKFSDLPTVRETLLVAEKYKINKLRLAAENYLNGVVKFGPILEMLRIAIEFDIPKLQSECIEIISTKYQDVLKSDELVSSPFEVMHAVLSFRPCCGEECQSQALLAIGKWNKRHETDRTHLESLLKCVDFTLANTIFEVNDKENEGLLSTEDIRALEKYKTTKKISDAPLWYQSSKYASESKDCDANAGVEKNASPKSFSERMKLQKSKVRRTCKEEVLCFAKSLKKNAADILKLHESAMNQTVQTIIDMVSETLEEGVDTYLEFFVDDMNDFKQNEEKESINVANQIVPSSETCKLSKNERCCIKESASAVSTEGQN